MREYKQASGCSPTDKHGPGQCVKGQQLKGWAVSLQAPTDHCSLNRWETKQMVGSTLGSVLYCLPGGSFIVRLNSSTLTVKCGKFSRHEPPTTPRSSNSLSMSCHNILGIFFSSCLTLRKILIFVCMCIYLSVCMCTMCVQELIEV